MMNRFSIYVRLILVLNLLVVGVGVAAAWVGSYVTGRLVERRLVDEAVENAASLVVEMRLPLTDTLMRQLRQILGSEMMAAAPDGTVVASSLPGKARRHFAQRIAVDPEARSLAFLGNRYRVGQAPVPDPRSPQTHLTGEARLFLLANEDRLRAAKHRASARIITVTAVAVAAATGIGLWLALTISRPVRGLSDYMAAVSRESAEEGQCPTVREQHDEGEAGVPSRLRRSFSHAPPELRQLADAFDRLLAEMARARRQMVDSARLAALGKLAASVAHELRNPLSGIKMNARVLTDELDSGTPAQECLDVMTREIARMDVFLQEMLSLAATSGQTAATHVGESETLSQDGDPVLEDVANSVLRLCAARCRHTDVDVQTRVASGRQRVAIGESALRQVILNLVFNALEAMPTGGELTVSAFDDPDRAGVGLSVADTGSGIDLPAEADIFEPFVTTKPHGTGLGLYVCKSILDSCGGTLAYETSHAGTTFTVRIPYGEAP